MGIGKKMEIPQLASDTECTGCTACYSACAIKCIKMKSDYAGFLRPEIDRESCVKCGMCQRVCPVIKKRSFKMIDGNQTYAAYSKDEKTRYVSSSGGIFSEIANIVLDHDGIVWGATYDATFKIRHIAIKSRKELYRLQGAKYSQSELGDAFSQIRQQLEHGKQILFCGTPCQVYGLKGYLLKEYDNLICIDFVCHSVPSPYAWDKYLDYRTKNDNAGKLPLSVNMRSKVSGWSHYGYSVMMDYGQERYLARSNQDMYMKLFVGGYLTRSSCMNCRFKGFERASDLTIGDCWGVWNFAPKMDDNKGTSLVIVHSEKGKTLFSEISESVVSLAISHEEALEVNRAISYSINANSYRNQALDMAVKGNYAMLEKMLNYKSYVRITKDKIKNVLNVLIRGRINNE